MSRFILLAPWLAALPSVCLAQVAEHWDRSVVDLESHAVEVFSDGDSLLASESSHLGPNGRDIVLQRFDSQGTLKWEFIYDGPQHNNDLIADLAIDDNGTTYLLGRDSNGANGQFVLLAIDSSGATSWEATHSISLPHLFTPSLAVDTGLNVTVSSQLGDEAWIGRYAPDGTLVWEATLDVFGSDTTGASDVAVASNGISYLAGFKPTGVSAWFMAAYDPNGTHLWTRTESGVVNVFPPAHAVADEFGNGFLIGSSESAFSTFEMRAVQYLPDGTEVWNTAYPGNSFLNTHLIDAAAVTGGDLILAGHGYTPSVSSGIDYLALRLRGSDGAISWFQYFNGPASGGDSVYDLEVDAAGRAYVTGNTDALPTTRDTTTVAYDVDGTLLWSRTRSEDLISPTLGVGAHGDLVTASRGWIGTPSLLVRYHAEIGTSYCVANSNSTGSAGAIEAFGSEALQVGDLRLVASPVPDQMGLFFYGLNANQVPFGHGFQCVTGGLVRLGPPTVATGGVALRDVSIPGSGISVGVSRFQYWHRDPSAGPPGFNTSDGLRLEFH